MKSCRTIRSRTWPRSRSWSSRRACLWSIATSQLRTCTNLSHSHARSRASSPMGMPASAQSHLSAGLFKSVAGVNIQPVPYRGIPSLLPDLLAGRVTMTLPNMSVVLPLVRDGKLRALMAMAPARPAALPDVPTLAEAGFTGFDTTVWFGLMAPSGTPQPIIDKLYSETARVLVRNDARKHLQDLGMETVANTPSEFAAMIKSEILQCAKLIKDAGIRVNE